MPDADGDLPDVHRLQCREIWGGIGETRTGLSVPGLDIWVTSRPVQPGHPGGDIHYLGLCGHGRLSRLVVADVAGHGPSVAGLAGKLHALMSRHMNTPDASTLVRGINDEFAPLADEGQFATAVVMTYDAAEDQMVIVNAGHLPPLWYSAAAGAWRELTGDLPEADTEIANLPLGIAAEIGYHPFAVRLGVGDLVVLFTDSLTEARRPGGAFLGREGLLECVGGLDPARPGRLNEDLIAAVRAWQGGRDPEDDLTLITLHHNAQDPPDVEEGTLAPGKQSH